MSTLINPYCDLSAARSEADNSDADDVESFIQAINSTSRWIDWYCRRDFLYHDAATVPVIVDQSWAALNKIYLPWPVIALTEIRIDGVVLAATSYRNLPNKLSPTGVIVGNADWFKPEAYVAAGLLPRKTYNLPLVIELYGTFGYAPASANPASTPSPNLPADLSKACAVASAVNSGKLKREYTSPDGSRNSATIKTIPKDAMAVFNSYRKLIV